MAAPIKSPDIAANILYCADNSLIGVLKYHKGHYHNVIPMNVHRSHARKSPPGNDLLYCWEFDKAGSVLGTRCFFVDKIEDFTPMELNDKNQKKPAYDIRTEILHGYFDSKAKGYLEKKQDEAEESEKEDNMRQRNRERRDDSNESNINPAERMTKHASFDERRVMRIAQKIMEFSGAEAHLYVPDKREDSYDEVGDDGRG